MEGGRRGSGWNIGMRKTRELVDEMDIWRRKGEVGTRARRNPRKEDRGTAAERETDWRMRLVRVCSVKGEKAELLECEFRGKRKRKKVRGRVRRCSY